MRQNARALDAYLSGLFEKLELTGVSVAAIGPGGESFTAGYGKRNADGSLPCDADTVHGIASMSKSHVTLACAILATEGKLSFDDPVYKYFPNFRLPGTPRDAVTLRHLAMHSAGIPPMEPLEWSIAMHAAPERQDEWIQKLRASAPNKMGTIDEIIEYIATCGYPLLGAPGEYMSYCNEGYALLSYVVDQAAGIPLEQFLKERVYGPLGMTRTVLDIDGSEARAMAGGNMTSLFSKDDDGTVKCDDAWSVLPPFRGCGLVKSTARDMATYYRCLANYGWYGGRQAIPSDAVELMIGAGFPASRIPAYCYGLYKRMFDRHVICEHGGALHGVSSHGGLLLGEGWGFASLCNQGDADVDCFNWAMYNWVNGTPLEKSHRWLQDAGRPFSDPAMVEGTFRGREGVPSDVSIYQKDGKLVAKRDEKVMPLTYCGGTLFAAFDDEGKLLMRMEAFVREGKAWGARFGSRIFQRV